MEYTASAFSECPRYAVVVRAHFWDDFLARQLERLRPFIRSGELFLSLDTTRGDIQPDAGVRTFKVSDSDILDAGFVAAGPGSLQWYSGDVPLYLFLAEHPDFEYYVQLEYDVGISFQFDDLIRGIDVRHGEFVALTKQDILHGRGAPDTWFWLDSCLDFYAANDVKHQLICLCAFSRRGLEQLKSARLLQAKAFLNGQVTRWPMCEGYLPTEAATQGLVQLELSELVDVSKYDWFPPHLEDDLNEIPSRAVMHPVLDRKSYVRNVLKQDPSVADLLGFRGWRHRKLRRLGLRGYVEALFSADFQSAIASAWSRRSSRKEAAMS